MVSHHRKGDKCPICSRCTRSDADIATWTLLAREKNLMKQARTARTAIAALVLSTAILLSGCAISQRTAGLDTTIGAAESPAVPVGLARPASGGTNNGGGGGGNVATPSLPTSWPLDTPVPPGRLLGSTSSTGRWTLLLLEAGSAAAVLKSAGASYQAAGFTPASTALWNKGTRHVTLVVENRDHSASKTFLVVQLTTS